MNVGRRICLSFLQEYIEAFLSFKFSFVQLCFNVAAIFIFLGFAPRLVLKEFIQSHALSFELSGNIA